MMSMSDIGGHNLSNAKVIWLAIKAPSTYF
jgi:hypothetical protein